MPVRKKVWSQTPAWIKGLYVAAAVVWAAVLALVAWQKLSVDPEILEYNVQHRLGGNGGEASSQEAVPEFVLESAAATTGNIDCLPPESTAQEHAAVCAAYETTQTRTVAIDGEGWIQYTDTAVDVQNRPADTGQAVEMAEAFLRVGGLLPERGYTRTLSRVQVKEEGCVVRFIPVYKGVPVLTDDYGAQLVVAQDGVVEMTCRWPVFADSAILEPREDRLEAQRAYLDYIAGQGRTPGAKVVCRRVYWCGKDSRSGQAAWMFGEGELFNHSVVIDSRTMEILSAF